MADIIWRSRVIPGIGRTIAANPNPAPRAVIVVAPAAPTPSPATPSPGLVIRYQQSDTNTSAKGDQRRCHNGARTWRNVDHRRVVLRYIDHLRIGGLNHIDRLV